MSEPDTSSADRSDRLERDAARWFARLRGEDAAADRAAFEAWLAEDPAHRRAYNRAAEIFALGKLIADEEAPAPPPSPRSRARRLVPALAALALLTLAAAGWMALKSSAPGGTAPDIAPDASGQAALLATAADETRTVRLADGSTVELAGDTRLQVRFDAARRGLELLGGQARFAVAHEVRPFVVRAGGGRVTARGTLFEVALRTDRRVEVRLLEGAVEVALPQGQGDAPPAIRQLRPGERLSFETHIGLVPTAARSPVLSPSAARNADASRDYDAVPVAALVAEANRASPRPIRLADAALASRRVSGRFRVDDTRLLADRLAGLFDWTADSSDRQEIVLRPK